MKQAISLVLILMLCVVLPGFADTDDLQRRVFIANSAEALRAAHESYVIHIVEKDQPVETDYVDHDFAISYNSNYYYGVRVRTSEYDYVALDEGGFKRFITIEQENDPWQFYVEGMLEMELVSAEEEGDTLVMTLRYPGNTWADFYPEAVESKEVHVLDAKSLELKSLRALAVMPGGSEEPVYDMTLEYDVERIYPEVIEAIEKHLYEEEHDTRTTTFIFDDGLPCQRTYIFETPVGDGCLSAEFEENGVQYAFDPERGEPSNEALDNDAVYYMMRATPEE